MNIAKPKRERKREERVCERDCNPKSCFSGLLLGVAVDVSLIG